MKITWKIAKKRGNYRPELTYTCIKDSWEVDLAVQRVSIVSTIPEVEMRYQAECLPGEYERSARYNPRTVGKVRLYTPHPEAERDSFTFLLPWRSGPSPDYPEVRGNTVQPFALPLFPAR